jgi:hypothetical protein
MDDRGMLNLGLGGLRVGGKVTDRYIRKSKHWFMAVVQQIISGMTSARRVAHEQLSW